MKRSLLHITVHLGGGVGKAILGSSSLCDEVFQTKIILLEAPEKKNIVETAIKEGMQIYLQPSRSLVEELIQQADIVILNWWNHPMMSEFLWNFPKVSCRLVLWLHVNGCTYPYVSFEFLNKFDFIFFTSKYSYENSLWSKKELNIVKMKSEVILGNGRFYPAGMVYKEEYEDKKDFIIGYVGTLNYSKMNKDFVNYCETASNMAENIKIMLVGDVGEDLLHDINNSAVSDKFIFAGHVDNVEELYLSMDVLGYIVNNENYGTTENVLLEAMACGVPVVASDGGAERNIITNGEDGFLVHDSEEFAERIVMLAKKPTLRCKIGQAGRKKVCKEFSCEKNIKAMIKSFGMICGKEMAIHEFQDILGQNPFEWFLYFTGKDKYLFEVNRKNWTSEELLRKNPIYAGERKSSLKHFLYYYPNDTSLNRIVNDMADRRKKGGEPEI